MGTLTLEPHEFSNLGQIILDCVDRFEPRKGLSGPTELFRGCYDYHSAVEGIWALTLMARLFPENGYFSAQIQERVSSKALEAEADFLAANPAFETPYGRGWILKLATEFERTFPNTHAFLAMQELAEQNYIHVRNHLEARDTPHWDGDHYNTAFAIWQLWDYQITRPNVRELERLKRLAFRFFGEPRKFKISDEQNDYFFLSPSLSVAHVMALTMAPEEFARWIEATIPTSILDSLTLPTEAGWMTHRYGLLSSRSWALRAISKALGGNAYIDAIQKTHRDAILPSIPLWKNDYMGTHWLPQYSLLALSQD